MKVWLKVRRGGAAQPVEQRRRRDGFPLRAAWDEVLTPITLWRNANDSPGYKPGTTYCRGRKTQRLDGNSRGVGGWSQCSLAEGRKVTASR